jgi:hypothetical protein
MPPLLEDYKDCIRRSSSYEDITRRIIKGGLTANCQYIFAELSRKGGAGKNYVILLSM